MSESEEWQETHLTPHGWVEGSHSADDGGVTWIDVPEDRVLTIRAVAAVGSTANVRQSTGVLWRHANDALIEDAVRRFGNPFEDLEL